MKSRARLIVLVALLAAPLCGLTAATAPEQVTGSFTDQPLLAVMEALATECHAGLAVDSRVAPMLARHVRMTFTKARWADVIDLVARSQHLDLALSDGWLRVATRAADDHPDAPVQTRRYPMATFTNALPARPGAALTGGGPTGGLLPPLEAEIRPEVNEIIELIQKIVSPGTWQQSGVLVQEDEGDVVVTQTPAVLAQLDAMLGELERRNARQVVCRFYRLDATAADVGTELDAAHWSMLAAGKPALAATFLAHDRQEQNHTALTEHPYLAGVLVDGGARAPQIAMLRTGLIVDVTPTVTITGVAATVRLSASVGLRMEQSPLSDAAGAPITTITTPVPTIDSAATTRRIPDGGAAIFHFDGRAYALTCEVLRYDDGGPLGPWRDPPGAHNDAKPAPAAPAATDKPAPSNF